MKLTWLGHACFKVESKGEVLIIDPYEDGSVPGLGPVRERASRVLCSHEHGDHAGRKAVELVPAAGEALTVEVLDTFHDDAGGTLRGPNKIFIISDGQYRVAHLGDIGCELTREQKEKLRGLDAVMVPVGGFFTIDGSQAAELVKAIAPRIAIPMHFRDDENGIGFGVIGTVQKFAESMGGAVAQSGSEADLADAFDGQVLILTPQNKL